MTGSVSEIFASLPRLGSEEAAAFARDLDEARESMERAPVHDPWAGRD